MALAKTEMTEIDEMLQARKKTHGPFKLHAEVVDGFHDAASPYLSNKSPVQREVVRMIFHKLARVLVGDGCYKDHWVDIAGYATRATEEIDNESL